MSSPLNRLMQEVAKSDDPEKRAAVEEWNALCHLLSHVDPVAMLRAVEVTAQCMKAYSNQAVH